jgi:hypothetical protein
LNVKDLVNLFGHYQILDNVKDFDLDKNHCGVLLKDNRVLNLNVHVDSFPLNNSEELLEETSHTLTTPDIGNIRSIVSGNGFNLLITENEEIYGQQLNPNADVSIGMAQPLDYDYTQPLHKIDMVSDYNSIHKTKVI